MKTITALLLCLALTLALATTVSASDPKIDGFRDNQTLMNGYMQSGSGRVKVDRDRQTVTYTKVLEPGYRDYINITGDLFEWEEDDAAVISANVLHDNSVSAQAVFTSGEEAVERVSINTRERQVVIEYASNLASTQPVEFSFNLHLMIRGKRYRDHGITFQGSIANPVITVNDSSSVNLIDGPVVQAGADIDKIRFKLSDATLTTNLKQGNRYYAASSAERLPTGNKLVVEHPGLVRRVDLHLDGLNTADTTVKLNKEYAGYYVYDKNLNYLGKGDERLPCQGRYYLSTKKWKS